jgi:hypothetical protein
LDSAVWKVRFHEQGGKVHDTLTDFVGSIIGLSDGSGFVACGSILDYNFPKASYGYLFKASPSGDSLWMRKYLPLGWTNDRARWMDLFQLQESPYGGLVTCGRVSDDSTSAIRGWVMHLDSMGCLVPGCDKTVSTEDLASGRQKAFEVYPNPVLSNWIYLLSRVRTDESLQMRLINIEGEILMQRTIDPQEGVQYMIPFPEETIPGIYLFQLMDVQGHLWLSERLIKP